jgi:TatD DNase family protein
MIDTHAHIYLPEFDMDREQIILNAQNNGVEKIFMPAIDSTTHQPMLKVQGKFTNCISMMGLHPCSVKENFEEEIKVVKNYLTHQHFLAIGEIGLDFYWDVSFSEQQYIAFHEQIKIALQYNLPIVIHSRNSIDECIKVVQQYPGTRGVFHCFSGNEKQAKDIIDLGFMLGIGGVVTFRNAGLDKAISKIGMQNIILETDAPYLAPVPFRGKRNEPAYIKLVAEKISAVTGYSVDEIEQLTTANAMKLFNVK